jgi:acyl carrier protein
MSTPVIKPQTAEVIQAWLVFQLSSRLAIDLQELDVRERFSRYGLDSVRATSLFADLAIALGRPLSPTLVWDYPTVEIAVGVAMEQKTGIRKKSLKMSVEG